MLDILKNGLIPRLTDQQANNKPLGANAIGEVLASIDPAEAHKPLKAVIRPLVAAVADNKKQMRDAAIQALDRGVVFENKAEIKCLQLTVSALGEGLAKPVARPELLEWATMRFGAMPVGTDMKLLVAPLLDCMVDKAVPIRELADQVVTNLDVSYMSPSSSVTIICHHRLSPSSMSPSSVIIVCHHRLSPSSSVTIVCHHALSPSSMSPSSVTFVCRRHLCHHRLSSPSVTVIYVAIVRHHRLPPSPTIVYVR